MIDDLVHLLELGHASAALAVAIAFSEADRIDSSSPQRHQLSELPPIAVTVTEHRLHRLRCPKCAQETQAELPTAVFRGAFGYRLLGPLVGV